ncbi:MAG: C69 family dipeptidase [Bacteroidales bacterium]|jgi:dipeptidase|nr:C69 family dipeptidase [Bacteroidales bacterium]
MNKKKLIFTVGACLLLYGNNVAQACTNFLVTKGATKDGSTFITYAADSHTLYGELYYRPAATYPAGTMLDIYEWDTGKKLGQIKQVSSTYSVVGNINEYQVAIGETTYGGRHELVDTTAIMDYGSLMYIALQRAKTAREAIKVIAELTNEYGYCSSGESFSISDGEEVWIMEIIGKGKKILDKNGNIDPKKNTNSAVWVAMRIPDGYISGHANHARITTFAKEDGKKSISFKNIGKIFTPTIEVVYATEVISYAREAGYFTGKDEEFSFSDVYAPVDFSAARGCESRVWSGFRKANPAKMAKYEDYARGDNLKNRMPLWIKPDRLLGIEDVMDMMRDHFQGTSMDMTKDKGAGPFVSPYRWRPMGWEYQGTKYLHERAISTQQTGFSFVAQGRSKYPAPVGGILWFGVDDTYTTCYVPIFCGITRIPNCVKEGNGDMMTYSSTSAFWLFNRVTNFVYSRYIDMIVDVQKVQKELESNFIAQVAEQSEQFAKEYNQDKDKGISVINNYSNKAANDMFNRWRQLDEYLLVKYIDGNIKKEKDGKFTNNGYSIKQPEFPEQPKYPDWYYKMIIDDTGDNLKVKE